MFFSILAHRVLRHRRLHQPARPRDPDARVRRALQPHRPPVSLDIHRQGARRM